MGINMCVDMSEMFVSSLWKGDFGKLFRVMFGFKRRSQLTCAVLPFCTKVKYRGDRWPYMAATLLLFFSLTLLSNLY